MLWTGASTIAFGFSSLECRRIVCSIHQHFKTLEISTEQNDKTAAVLRPNITGEIDNVVNMRGGVGEAWIRVHKSLPRRCNFRAEF